ncbi:MAG TPA: TonB-dependent receptor [Thermoanaerobaculia bacterium]|nr:TonB-dependent receptor [Thermoanaerobaculia bacterium]
MPNLAARSAFVVSLFAASALLPTGSDSSVLAQETEAPPETGVQAEEEESPQDEPVVEEAPQTFAEQISVTARKREEMIGDVPFSLAAPTEDVLRERGASDLEGVSANVAGFSVQNLGPGQSQVAMRGVSAGQIVRDQPGVKEQVGVYLDESVISLSLFTPDLDLFDLSRVEVLRGPQGTLFGSGSLSGTVRYITNKPELGVAESFGEFSVDSVDGGGVGGTAKAAVNAPLGDNAAMRVTAYFTSYGGFLDAVQPGLSVADDVNDGERVGARVALQFEPNERLTITPRLIYQEVEMNGWNRIDDFNILANPFTTTRPAVDLGERQQFIQLQEDFSDEFLLVDLTLEYDLGPSTLTSITSYTDRDVFVRRDAGALTGSITGGTIGLPESVYTLDAPLDDATTAQMLTQELRLSGERGRLFWVGGIFYSEMDRDYGQDLLVSGFEDATGIPTAGFRAPKDVLFFSDLSYEFEQLALFGEATYSLSDRLDLTGGVRFYDFEETRDQVFDGIFSDAGPSSGSVTADGFAPRIIASYELSERTDLNAQVSKGFRLGGINDPLNIPLCRGQDEATFSGNEFWDDEELWNYEVGSKSTFMNGRGSFNAAAFYMDISDLQATVTAGTCSSRLVLNVPEARSTGIELELAAQPNPTFDFAVSASYTDSELGSTLSRTDPQGNVLIISGIEKGKRLPTVPELQAAAAANYRWEMRQGRAGYVSGTYQYVGSRFTQIGDQEAGFGTVDLLALPNTIGGPLTQSVFRFDPELPAYDILNLRVGVLSDRWDVALFVNNVLDERALLALDQERGRLGRVGYLTNQPRTLGISTRVNF